MERKKIEVFIQELNEVRNNRQLLEKYKAEPDKPERIEANQKARERLLLALLKDHQASDYDIASFLYDAESLLRKKPPYFLEEYEVDPLYLAAYILGQFGKVEDIWRFIETKMIDIDSRIGFDTEFLLSFGIEKVFAHLKITEHPMKSSLIRFIGKDLTECNYMEEEIDYWRKGKQNYFLED